MSTDEEKRRHVRCALIAEIQYVSNSPVLTARISDVSMGGVFVDTVNALELGSKVKFRLILPPEISETPIVGEGIVTWRQQTVGMGIKFTAMEKSDWSNIKSYIMKQGE
jgi:hypothetical protein